MPFPARPDLERLRYWQGQTLRSSDFTSQLAIDAELRGWHNRALHSAAGVAWGFEVGNPQQSGGVLRVTVNCGVAYDCYGRELVLQASRSIAVPNIAAGVPATLFVRYASPACSCGEADPCGPAHGHPLEEALEFTWESGLETRASGVPLTRLRLENGAPAKDPDFRRPLTRALAKPRLANGETVHGNTPWERWLEEVPDGRGGVIELEVGVQMHVDTSASGFTSTPCYFASLAGETANLFDDTSAPSYFTSIADPTAEGFTFRLLMLGIARRRLQVAASASRVSELSGPAGASTVQVVNGTAFRNGDAIAIVSPRAPSAVGLEEIDGDEIELSQAIAGLEVGSTLAIAHTAAKTKVARVLEQQRASAIQVDDAAGAQGGDVLVRVTDDPAALEAAVIDTVASNVLTLRSSLKEIADGDEVAIARPADAPRVAKASTRNNVMTVALEGAATLQAGDVVVRLTAAGPGAASIVGEITADGAILRSRIKGLRKGEALAVANRSHVVASVSSIARAMQVEVDEPDLFRRGDVAGRIASDGAIAGAAVVQQIENDELSLATPISGLAGEDVLLRAEHVVLTRVVAIDPVAIPMRITVGDTRHIRLGDLVSRHAASGPQGPAATVQDVQGSTIVVDPRIDSLTVGDHLAVSRFPRTAKVVSVLEQGGRTFLTVDRVTGIAAGDVLARATQSAPLWEVDAAAGVSIILRAVATGLGAADEVSTVAFVDALTVRAIDAADAKKVTVTETRDLRKGSAAGLLGHFVEMSPVVNVTFVSGRDVGLSSMVDGIAPGVILGPASLTPSQTRIRLESVEGVRAGQPISVTAHELTTGRLATALLRVSNIDPTLNAIALIPVQSGAVYRFRPETMLAAVTYNANFAAGFAAFARRHKMYVCWLGCQNENRPPLDCPGVVPAASGCGCK